MNGREESKEERGKRRPWRCGDGREPLSFPRGSIGTSPGRCSARDVVPVSPPAGRERDHPARARCEVEKALRPRAPADDAGEMTRASTRTGWPSRPALIATEAARGCDDRESNRRAPAGRRGREGNLAERRRPASWPCRGRGGRALSILGLRAQQMHSAAACASDGRRREEGGRGRAGLRLSAARAPPRRATSSSCEPASPASPHRLSWFALHFVSQDAQVAMV